MKKLIIFFCCAFSVSANAQITAADPTYSVISSTSTAAVSLVNSVLSAGTSTTGGTTATLLATTTDSTAITGSVKIAGPATLTINVLGEQDDDPEDTVTLTTTEVSSVGTTATKADSGIKQEWLTRRKGADARALVNPQLIK